MEHLSNYFRIFKIFIKFYIPNNAVLVVAGDEKNQTKEWIENTLAL
jgi:predicted Zn-dependent peptidase